MERGGEGVEWRGVGRGWGRRKTMTVNISPPGVSLALLPLPFHVMFTEKLCKASNFAITESRNSVSLNR